MPSSEGYFTPTPQRSADELTLGTPQPGRAQGAAIPVTCLQPSGWPTGRGSRYLSSERTADPGRAARELTAEAGPAGARALQQPGCAARQAKFTLT